MQTHAHTQDDGVDLVRHFESGIGALKDVHRLFGICFSYSEVRPVLLILLQHAHTHTHTYNTHTHTHTQQYQ